MRRSRERLANWRLHGSPGRYAQAFLALSFAVLPVPSDARGGKLSIPRGGPVQIDGVMAFDEWQKASSATIGVAPDWKVKVLAQHDDANLYFAFSGLKHGAQRMFPEILLDPANQKPQAWQRGIFWFHVSHNLCEGDGIHDNYRRDGIFQCSHTKAGWEGNNPPGETTDAVEVRISFEKLGIRYVPRMTIGLSLEVTNATGDASQKWSFWPREATLSNPSSWGSATLE